MGTRRDDLLEASMRDYFNGNISYEAFANDINKYSGVNLTPDQESRIQHFGKQVQSGDYTEAWGRNNIYQTLDLPPQPYMQGQGTTVTPTVTTPSSELTEEEAWRIVSSATQNKNNKSIYNIDDMYAAVDAANEDLARYTYEEFIKGDSYADLAKRYTAQGTQAMQDTLGQIAARTGGLASSYAGGAAQGSYNNYMDALEDAARQMYATERGELEDQRNYAYQMAMQKYNTMDNERDFAYGIEKANIERADNAQKAAADRVNTYLSAGGDVDNLDKDLVKTSGYTPEELAVISKYYENQAAQKEVVKEPEVTDLNEKMRIAKITTKNGAINYLTQLNKYDEDEIEDLATYYMETYLPSQASIDSSVGNTTQTGDSRVLTGDEDIPKNASFTNKIAFNDDGTIKWVVVGSYGGRISGDELAAKINSGEVVPVYNPNNNTITFRRA